MPELPRGADAPEHDPQPSAAHAHASTGDYVSLASTGDASPQSTVDAATSRAPPTSAGDRFTILRLHARGGLGQVSLARDEKLKRSVALKEIRPDKRGNASLRQRFLTEAEITGQLEHPGIVPIYDLNQDSDGQVRYAMRFVQGRTLKDAIEAYHRQPTPLGFRELLHRFVSVCQTVAYAHNQGVIHRDLKPANVILGDYGESLVVDWGLAKRLAAASPAPASRDEPLTQQSATPEPATDGLSAQTDDAPLTQAGQVLGTPAYMAPEQAAGDIAGTGMPADIYSLGAILYETLTGRPPYQGKNAAEVLAAVREGHLAPPTRVQRSVPRALEAVCLKAMSRDLALRYAGAAQLAKDVEHWLADEPVTAYREPLRTRLGRRARRHQVAVAAGVAGLVMLLVGLTWFWDFRWHQVQALGQQVADRQRIALDNAHADNLEQAIAMLTDAERLARTEASLAETHVELAGQLQQLEQLRRFRQLARATLLEGSHGFGARQRPDAIVGKCEAALALYQVQEDPRWEAALDGSVLTAAQVRDVKDLVAELSITVALREALYDTRDEAGRAATRRALTLLDRAEALGRAGHDVWHLRWHFYRRLGEKEAADHAGDKAVRVPPQSALDYYVLGSMLTHKFKQPREGVNAYLRAMTLQPNHYGANLGLFFANKDLRNLPEQITALTVCQALRPDAAELYFFRGFAYFESKAYGRALGDFNNLLQRDPKHKSGLYWRGRSWFVLSNAKKPHWAEAEQDFTAALALDADDALPYPWRAMARAQLHRYREAAEDAELAVKRLRSTLTPWYAARAYAQCARAAGDDAGAADREQLADGYARRAVELLRQAVQGGQIGAAELRQSRDLEPLHARTDFRQLVVEVEAKARK
jgi:tetratricopeptide (TPR) repeat protein